jgi:SAM-dependent methyltransferase
MDAPSAAEHWSRVWTSKEPTEFSWFEAEPRTSVEMVAALGLPADAPILDVGGGASALARELVSLGFSDVSVADISGQALEKARAAVGPKSDRITWIEADVRSHDFGRRFRLWHDRAVFHFMTEPSDREAYLEALGRSLEPGGHLIIATFGPDGPSRCSGLPVQRYGAPELADVLAPLARLVSSRLEEHVTPAGSSQQFLYAHLEAAPATGRRPG